MADSLNLGYTVQVEDSSLKLSFKLLSEDPEGIARDLLMAAINELEVVAKRFRHEETTPVGDDLD